MWFLGLKVFNTITKGRGIICERRFGRGEFVVEYRGELRLSFILYNHSSEGWG